MLPEEKPADSSADPFLEGLQLSQDFIENAGVKKLILSVPCVRPHRQHYVRTHPSEDFRKPFAIIELKEDREHYILTPEVASALPGEFANVILTTTINRQGVVSLWPVRLPTPDGKTNEWHRTAALAAEHAKTKWVRVAPNLSLGAYEVFEAVGSLPEPQWPDLTYAELIRIAFKDRIVRDADHPLLQRLRGAV